MVNERTDGDLYSGMTSRSAADVKAKKAEVSQAKKDESNLIEKDRNAIDNIIAEEKASIPMKLLELTSAAMPADQVKETAGSIRLYIDLLDKLTNKLAQLDRKKDVVVQGESFDE